jgi:hypothetical protein
VLAAHPMARRGARCALVCSGRVDRLALWVRPTTDWPSRAESPWLFAQCPFGALENSARGRSGREGLQAHRRRWVPGDHTLSMGFRQGVATPLKEQPGVSHPQCFGVRTLSITVKVLGVGQAGLRSCHTLVFVLMLSLSYPRRGAERLSYLNRIGGDECRCGRFSKDLLLTNVMLYWVPGSIGSSMRLYPSHVCAGTGLAPATSAPHPCHICTTGARPQPSGRMRCCRAELASVIRALQGTLGPHSTYYPMRLTHSGLQPLRARRWLRCERRKTRRRLSRQHWVHRTADAMSPGRDPRVGGAAGGL